MFEASDDPQRQIVNRGEVQGKNDGNRSENQCGE
jgi:hypothetical protein